MMRHAPAGTSASSEMAASAACPERTPGVARDHRVQRVAQRRNDDLELVSGQLSEVCRDRQDRIAPQGIFACPRQPEYDRSPVTRALLAGEMPLLLQ